MKDKIKQLLGANLPASVVASACGVSESYVSQLLAEEPFAEEVQTLRVQNLTLHAARDKKYDTLEDSLLEKLETLLPMLTNPMAVINALGKINGAKRRATPTELGGGAPRQIVHLHLPAVLLAKFVVNNQNQVIEVEGRTIATMPANQVLKQLEDRREAETINVAAQKKDFEDAKGRLQILERLTHLPVHEVL